MRCSSNATFPFLSSSYCAYITRKAVNNMTLITSSKNTHVYTKGEEVRQAGSKVPLVYENTAADLYQPELDDILNCHKLEDGLFDEDDGNREELNVTTDNTAESTISTDSAKKRINSVLPDFPIGVHRASLIVPMKHAVQHSLELNSTTTTTRKTSENLEKQ